MSWGKQTDTACFNPRLMRLARGGDDRQADECYGVASRLLAWSGEHRTDGWLPDEIVDMLLGHRRERVLGALVREGFVVGRMVKGVGIPRLAKHPEHGEGLQLVINHEDGLLHNRTKAEEDADRAAYFGVDEVERLHILLRDGDQCRYCSITVNPHDKRGPRRRCFDHVDPAGPGDETNVVVACWRCNSRKGDKTPADVGLELKRPPRERGEDVHWHETTERMLIKARLLGPRLARPTDDTSTTPRPARPVDDSTTPRLPRDLADTVVDEKLGHHLAEIATTQPGSNADQRPTRGPGPEVDRVGSGPVGSGLARDGTGGPSPPRTRRVRGGSRNRPPGAASA